MPTTLTPDFSAADLIGSELIEQYAGDDVEQLLERIVVHDIQTSGTSLSVGLAVVATDTSTIPLIGSYVGLDLSANSAVADDTADWISLGTFSGSLNPLSLTATFNAKLTFSPDLITPADGTTQFVASLNPALGVTVDPDGVHVSGGAITLPSLPDQDAQGQTVQWYGLGGTGIQFAGDGTTHGGTMALALWGDNPALVKLGVDAGFRGLFIEGIKIRLPQELSQNGRPIVVNVATATVDRSGLSFNASMDFTGTTLTLFGVSLTPQKLALSVAGNSIAAASLGAVVTLPFFDKPVDITLGIHDGGWSLALQSDFVDLDLDGMKLHLTGLGLEQRDGDTWFKLSGSIKVSVPAFPDAPELVLKDVLIDRHGHIKASGGMMELDSQKTFRFGDILTAKLAKFGFGTNTDNTKFVVFSGEISLLEALSMTGKFTNLKFSWGNGSVAVTLDDVEIDVTEAGVFQFAGKLRLKPPPGATHGFSGSISLGLKDPSFGLDGALVVAEVGSGSSQCTAFGLSLSITIPTGIPLGQSGLGIFGFNGLLAWNYGPNFALLPNPNAPDKWIQWFLASPIGVDDLLAKWGVAPPNKAFGAGVSFGTMVDGSFTWHAKTSFILMIPGPVLILNGSADFISLPPGLLSGATGAMQAMLTYDGRARTMSAAVSAQIGKDPIVSASGAAAAFFDLNDPSAWYFDIGTTDKPLQAQAVKIVKAQAFLDLGLQQTGQFAGQRGLFFGLQGGVDQSFNYPPLADVKAQFHIDAWPPRGVTILPRPMRMDGSVALTGCISVELVKIALTVTLSADLDIKLVVSASKPQYLAYQIQATLDATFKVDIGIHAWFVNIDIHAHVDASFNFAVSGQIPAPQAGQPALSATALDPPPRPLAHVSLEHAYTTDVWELPFATRAPDDSVVLPERDPQGAPPLMHYIVPVDILPTLTFSVPIADGGAPPFGANYPIAQSVPIGNTSYVYTLDTITITGPGGQVFPAPGAASAIPPGFWCEELGAQGKTRLQLWSDNPYFLSLRAGPDSRAADQQAITGGCPCDAPPAAAPTCVHLRDFPHLALANGDRFLAQPCKDDIIAISGTHWISYASAIVQSAPESYALLQGGATMAFDSALGEVDLHFVTVQSGAQTIASASVNPADFTLLARDGSPLPTSGKLTVDAANSTSTLALTTPGAAYGLRVGVESKSALYEICYLSRADATLLGATGSSSAAQRQSALAASANDTAPRPVLDPWTSYQMTIQSHATRSDGVVTSFTDTLQFQTGNPPALVDSAREQTLVTAGTVAASLDSRYPHAGPLATLDAYIAATVPLADTQRCKQATCDLAYRGYDPCVTFSEGYVPALYGGSLSLSVVDLNGAALVTTAPIGAPIAQPPRGPLNLVKHVRSAPHQPDRFDTLWASQLQCCGLTPGAASNSQLGLPLGPRIALAPRRGYELQTLHAQSVVASARFYSSRFTTMTHQLQSHRGVVARAAAAGLAGALGAGATFESIASALALSPTAPRETLDITALTAATGATIGLLITSPEPLPWDRLTVAVEYAPTAAVVLRSVRPAPPARNMKVIGYQMDGAGHGYIDVMLLGDADPSGWAVTTWPASPQLNAPGVPLYRFSAEGVWPGGTVFRIGTPPFAGAPGDWLTREVAQVPASLSVGVVDGAGKLCHREAVVSTNPVATSTYAKADATAFLIVSANAAPWPGGNYSLHFTCKRDLGRGADPGALRVYARNGDTSDEQSRLQLFL